jgi:peptidoglycan/LPS O-acetylase OafA/YrhL
VSKPVRHIPSLDGLRALSFLLVFAAHAGLERYVPGGFGVTIFFFLSGFLITTLMRAEHERNGRVNFGHFWLRRALRILPPFYLVLTGAVLLSVYVAGRDSLSGMAILAQAAHYTNYWIIFHGYDGLPGGTGVYWSLAVEEHFYVLFPWIYAGLQRLKASAANQALIFWGVCALVLCWRCVLVFGLHSPVDRTYIASDTRLDSILFGCALAVWRNPVLDETALRERRWKYGFVPGALMVLLLCLTIRGDAFRETLRYSLQGIALSAIFVAAIRYHEWLPFRLLNSRVAIFLGLLSYSLYLLHYAIIYGVRHLLADLNPALQAAVALAISIALAFALYVGVEKPCARLRKRLTD